MRPIAIVPGLIAALAISCLYVSRLNACDISQNPYCSIDDIGPADQSSAGHAKDNATADANAQTNSTFVSQGKSKRHRLSRSQRRARDAAARDAMAKASDTDRSGEIEKTSDDDKAGSAQARQDQARQDDDIGLQAPARDGKQRRETKAAAHGGVTASGNIASIPAHAIAGAVQPQASEYSPLFSVQAAESAIPTLQTIIPVVDAHTFNEIDRMVDSGDSGAPAADADTSLNSKPLNAMASMNMAMADEAPSEWRKWLPFSGTSVIGQVFIALGSLLTLATAARMIIV